MSYPVVDARTVLVDALKIDLEDFQLSNTILPSKGSIKGIFELQALTSDLLTFAKDPDQGLSMLPEKPPEPDISKLGPEEADRLKAEYQELMKIYEGQKQAYSMHIPYDDYITIQNYLLRFKKTITATRAIKGNMFYSFTKKEDREESGMFSFLKKKNNQQQ